jgi:desulfoferrodoxin (superoxide reductase-like protein)
MGNKNFTQKIIESAKKSEENKKYIKEDFGAGLFKTAVQFKKYQDNFVNTIQKKQIPKELDVFKIKADKINAREYCNVHGLWKS